MSQHLTTAQLMTLNAACMPIKEHLATPYLVGSSRKSDEFRDVDVRCIVEDERFDRLFPEEPVWGLFCWAVSEMLSKVTGLPIDFQVQRMTEANERFQSGRSALGLRGFVFAGGGDATPYRPHSGKSPTTNEGDRP